MEKVGKHFALSNTKRKHSFTTGPLRHYRAPVLVHGPQYM